MGENMMQLLWVDGKARDPNQPKLVLCASFLISSLKKLTEPMVLRNSVRFFRLDLDLIDFAMMVCLFFGVWFVGVWVVVGGVWCLLQATARLRYWFSYIIQKASTPTTILWNLSVGGPRSTYPNPLSLQRLFPNTTSWWRPCLARPPTMIPSNI